MSFYHQRFGISSTAFLHASRTGLLGLSVCQVWCRIRVSERTYSHTSSLARKRLNTNIMVINRIRKFSEINGGAGVREPVSVRRLVIPGYYDYVIIIVIIIIKYYMHTVAIVVIP